MKKFVFFLVLVFLCVFALSWVASDNSVEITRAQGVIEAARAAQDAARAAQIASQGLSDVGRGQTFILVLLTLVLVVLVGLVVYITIQRQIWKHAQVLTKNSGRWMSGPNANWKRVENPDPYQQLLLQQQMLITQLLQQNQMEAGENDQPQLPDGWWG
jgi:hypothetical protein